ncbi:MAG TPA: DEAD/DEAH box helicase, partial [Massilibacterium sp.]|nr:DEAD/DEAH box helicase [Massilibacterium sp.]
NLFQVDTFSPGQLEVITTLLQGRNTIAVAPTEMDQSLPYQLVAFLQPVPTLVIVPIPSFMYDEIHHLKEHKITRVPEMTRNQRKKESILQKYRENRSLLMFVAPEYVQTKSFRTFLQETPIGFIVIHDVHSLSEWSDTFRTSYLHIGQTLRTYCKKAVLLGLTKEVAVSVLQDIKSELQTADIVTLNHRPELSFEVVEAGPDYAEKQQALTKIVREKGEAHGIVFTLNASGRKGAIR